MAFAAMLATGAVSCTSSPPPPVTKTPVSLLDPACPVLTPEEVSVVRIPEGTPEESIQNVLQSYGAWINAGTDLVRGWRGAGLDVPETCVNGVAAQFRMAYEGSIFTTQTDAAWQDYFAGQEKLTAQSLQETLASSDAAAGAEGHFELLQQIDASATDNGTFLKFDAIYQPAQNSPAGQQSSAPTDSPSVSSTDAPVGASDWGGLAEPTRWYVELVPFDGYFIINYIEQTPTGGY